MPLIQSKSKKAASENIKKEMAAGKPQKQAIAIAMSVQRRNRSKKYSSGGMVQEDNQPKSIVEAIMQRRSDKNDTVDIEENNQIEASDFDELNEEALDYNPDSAMEVIEEEPKDLVSKIRARIKARRGY